MNEYARLTNFIIGYFRVPPGLGIKTRLSAQPLIWKSFFILIQIKLIFTRQFVHALGLVLKVRQFRTRKWGGLLRFIRWGCICEIKTKSYFVIGDMQTHSNDIPHKKDNSVTVIHIFMCRITNKEGLPKMPFKVENVGVPRGQNKPFSKTLTSKLLWAWRE